MDFGIKGRRALVTGGSRGLGRSCALALASEGVNIAICARSDNDLDLAMGEIEAKSVRCHGFKIDLSEEGAADELFARSSESMGGIDIMVNNVGGSLGTKGVETTSLEDFRKVHELNFWSAMRFMQLSIPSMAERSWGADYKYHVHIRQRVRWECSLHVCKGQPNRTRQTFGYGYC